MKAKWFTPALGVLAGAAITVLGFVTPAVYNLKFLMILGGMVVIGVSLALAYLMDEDSNADTPARPLGTSQPMPTYTYTKTMTKQPMSATTTEACDPGVIARKAEDLANPEPAKRRLLIGIGGDAAALDEDMLDVDFKVWITGENLPTKHLKGQLGLGLQRSPRTRGRL